MHLRPLGRTGIQVSACCLGTMTYGEQNTEAEGHAQLDYARDRGVNFLDTAELYSIPPKPETLGRTEEIIGAWFRARGGRDRWIVATKITGRSDSMTWFRDQPRPARVARDQIDEAVLKSLRRLGTDYIDLYQIHWPDRRYSGFGHFAYRDYDADYAPFEEQLEALARHVEAGRIRAIGVSNESPWGLMKFIALAEARGWPRMSSIQNAYNLVNRTFEQGLAEIALRENVGLLAYSPLGQGYLTGKYRGGHTPPGTRKAMFNRLGRYEHPAAEPAIEAYLDLAAKWGWDPGQMALKFCDTRPFMTATIIGATNLTQLQTNIDAFDKPWPDELDRAIDSLFETYKSPCP